MLPLNTVTLTECPRGWRLSMR